MANPNKLIECFDAPWTDFQFPWEVIGRIVKKAGATQPVVFEYDSQRLRVLEVHYSDTLQRQSFGQTLKDRAEDLARLMERQSVFSLGVTFEEVGPLLTVLCKIMADKRMLFRISVRPSFQVKPGEANPEMNVSFRRMIASSEGHLVDAPVAEGPDFGGRNGGGRVRSWKSQPGEGA